MFVPRDFSPPEALETKDFKLRTLTIDDVVKDYDAVMTSVDHLKSVFGEKTSWPSKDLTLKQDLIDLGWHQKEFQTKSSFAYTVVTLDERECLGCVYIFPSNKESYEAEIYTWVRQSAFGKGLDPILFNAVKNWIAKDWPFKRVAYPGRGIDWKSWKEMK